MNKVSRRELARWATDRLIAGDDAGDVAKHLAAVLVESKRASEANFLVSDIEWELESRQALATARVTSATPLSAQLQTALAEQIKRITKTGEVIIDNQIDKKVIGGVRVETASHVWDNTVSRKLSELREVF